MNTAARAALHVQQALRHDYDLMAIDGTAAATVSTTEKSAGVNPRVSELKLVIAESRARLIEPSRAHP
jgi:hypothetical protein